MADPPPRKFALRLILLEDGEEAVHVVYVPVKPWGLTQAIDEAKQAMLVNIANDYVREADG